MQQRLSLSATLYVWLIVVGCCGLRGSQIPKQGKAILSYGKRISAGFGIVPFASGDVL
jgi:hypothetical protein